MQRKRRYGLVTCKLRAFVLTLPKCNIFVVESNVYDFNNNEKVQLQL